MRAARADRERLARALARNKERQAQLEAELVALEKERQQLQDRDRLLESLGAHAVPQPRSELGENADTVDHEILRGAQIREQAARIFYKRYGPGTARHYRELFNLLVESGVEISGKDPIATFLTNLSRSPVVVRGGESGTYAIDADAPDMLRARLGELHAELVDLAGVISRNDGPAQDLLDHRAELMSEIRKQERLLAEAERVLDQVANQSLAEAA
jgi:chromosome segregation ATPase